MDFTVVVGVDRDHLEQWKIVWPTWVRWKPNLLSRPWVIFFDMSELRPTDVLRVNQLEKIENLQLVGWNPSRWRNQRGKMLAGFVHVPARRVTTTYWLKLDTDVVATGNDDWIEEDWFSRNPAIVAHSWGYTKPADQMVVLDKWVEENKDLLPELAGSEPLNLAPTAGSSCLPHKRIISWCGFFETAFVRKAAEFANRTGGGGLLPVDSQNGYLWYCARRLGLEIKRVNMKQRGWEHWLKDDNLREACLRSLGREG